MNESQKRTLRIHNPDLVHDLDLTADLVAKFIHHGIFKEEMIDEIKSEKTRRERVQKVLLLLPRRGPRAFDMFVHSIQDTYPWLAEKLRKTHQKISLKTEPDMISLKEKVDIYVHETFGNSKRLCEDDKKDIRKFLYKHLRSHSNDSESSDNVNNHNHRRDSIQSEDSVNLNVLQDNNQSELTELKDNNQNIVDEKDIELKILQRVYNMFHSNQSSSEDLDDVDGRQANITIETIEKEVSQMNKNAETLQNEIKDCFSVLGLQNCEYSLHEVLETYAEKRQSEVLQLSNLRERLDTVERQRHKLAEKLKSKERELQQSLNELRNAEHENEKTKVLIRDLKNKCDRLEQLHVKHVEKQQTLMTLKSMVQELSPASRQIQGPFKYSNGMDEVDGQQLQLPQIAQHCNPRQSRQSRKSGYRDRSTSSHHDLPKSQVQSSGYPWKY